MHFKIIFFNVLVVIYHPQEGAAELGLPLFSIASVLWQNYNV